MLEMAFLDGGFSLLRLEPLANAVIATLVFFALGLYGVGHLLPRLWLKAERAWLRFLLGKTTAAQLVIDYAEKDFMLSIQQQVLDEGHQQPLAVLMAVFSRLKEYFLKDRNEGLKKMKDWKTTAMYSSAVEKLNRGWREGTQPEILYRYMERIRSLAGDITDEKERLRGLCSVAIVTYALGDLKGGNKLGAKNWEEAQGARPAVRSMLKWMASYAYFNSTMFLGDFESAMRMMASQWRGDYADYDDDSKRMMRNDLSEIITLNPILAIPRHIILAAAFNDGAYPALDDVKYWPSRTAFDALPPGLSKVEKEIKWGETWFDEARGVCRHEDASYNFSLAYAGFYFTLLLLEASPEQRVALDAKIREAFNSIPEDSPFVSRYVKYGFSGVYHLASGRPSEALRDLTRAAQFSNVSGNKFAECIFTCCHALAAACASAESDPDFVPEVDYYLKEAKSLANDIGGNFYPELYEGAQFAVLKLRGRHGDANRKALRSRYSQGGKRLLRIFQQTCGVHGTVLPAAGYPQSLPPSHREGRQSS